MRLQAREVADRRIEPDVEILARGIRDRDPEVRRVARDVPVGETFRRRRVAQPFQRLVRHFGLQPAVLRPAAQEFDACGVREPEEVVLRGLEHRRCARQRRIRIPEIGRCVDGAAVLAGVAVLVLRAALRALALDVAVGEEHLLHRVEVLFDRLRIGQARGLELPVDVLRQLDILGRIGRVPVIEADVEAREMLRPRRGDARDQRLRRHAFGFRLQHDRRAVRVVGTDEVHGVTLHAPEAHPDVGLDVLHDVADVKRSVRIRQRRGDEQFPR